VIRPVNIYNMAQVFRGGSAVAVIGLGIVWLALAAPAQTEQKFKTRLAPVPRDTPMLATVAGIGSAAAVLSGTKLSVTGTFEGLKSPATTARVYQGKAIGVRGPVAFDLTVTPAVSGSISGSSDLTAGQVENLKKGKFYIQIDSEKAPGGNFWGWLGH